MFRAKQTNELVRRVVVYGCVISTSVFAAGAHARDRGEVRRSEAPSQEAQVSEDREPASEQRPVRRGGLLSGKSSARPVEAAPERSSGGRSPWSGLFGRRSESRDNSPTATPRSENPRISRAPVAEPPRQASSPSRPALTYQRPDVSEHAVLRSPPDRNVGQQLVRPQVADASRREPSVLAAEPDRERPTRSGRSDGGRGDGVPAGSDRTRVRGGDDGSQTVRRAPGGDDGSQAVRRAPSGDDGSQAVRRAPGGDDGSQTVRRAPGGDDGSQTVRRAPGGADRPSATVRPDAPPPRPVERPEVQSPQSPRPEVRAPQRPRPEVPAQPRPVQRPDGDVVRGGGDAARSGNDVTRSGAGNDRNQSSGTPVVRPRDDVGRTIARPATPAGEPTRRAPAGADTVRRGDATTSGQPRTSPVVRPDAGVSRMPANDSGTPISRTRDDVARTISRPSTTTGNDRLRRSDDGRGAPDLSNGGRSRPVTMSRNGAGRTSTGADRAPIARTRDEAARSMGRTSPGGTRNGTGDVTRLSRESGTRSGAVHGADAGSRMAGTRSLERAAPSRATDGRSQVARRAADESLRNRTLSQGRVGGREVAVRASERVSSRDVHVYDVGHHGNGHADFIGHYQGGWHPSQYHYDHYWWPHHYYHDVDVGFSFTYVHSYYAPAHVMVYDVVPVVPVIVEPAPAFSVSFSYYSAPAVVSFRSVRYVYPMATVAPVVVVYREYVAPPIMTPVLFTPVITTAVVSVPVFVPGVAPVYAPVYYYYPAYTVMSYPTYYVEPTPALVAEPVVVEAPSSSWSISSAFGFSHHGKEFNIGGSFSKERSEPTVVADPAGTVEQPASDDIAMTGPAAAVAPAQSADQATLESGLAAIRAGDMEQARRILTQVVVNDPSDGMARMLYTSTMLADGQYKDAAEGLRRALETWQDLQLKDYYLPSVYDDAQRFTQTMRDVREFLSDHPERVDAWLLVGFSYAFSGETEQAQTVIAEAQKTWPEDPSFATLLKIVQAG